MISLKFLITSLIVVLIPGTGVIYTVSTGISRGNKASISAAIGCTIGIIPHLLATILGLAAIMHTSALVFQTLKYAGALYLLYVAYATWRNKSAFSLDETPSIDSSIELILKGIMLNILNPKLTIFFLAFLPQFVPAGTTAPIAHLVALSVVFMIMTFVIFAVYGLLSHAFRKTVIESLRVQGWLRRGFAATFACLGISLAFSDQ